MGDMPLMTDKGTFIINGTERVIVSQMHRSPGVFFDHDKGKTHASGKLLFAARVIPYRGSWLDFEFDAKDIVYVRIDRRRKLPVTALLQSLDMTHEDILNYFYDRVDFKLSKKGWRTPFVVERVRGSRLLRNLVDADSEKVVAEAGTKVTPRQANKLVEAGLKDILVSHLDLVGRFVAEDMINPETGEVFIEAGDELTEQLIDQLEAAGFDEITTLDIDNVNVGPYIRNTLAVDKSSTREQALVDIYRVMRPGEPPTERDQQCAV